MIHFLFSNTHYGNTHSADVKSEWMKSAHTLKGTVMNCLRTQYVDKALSLTGVCKDKLRLMIRESVLRFHLDPVLRQSCQADLLSHCKKEVRCIRVFFHFQHDRYLRVINRFVVHLLNLRVNTILRVNIVICHFTVDREPCVPVFGLWAAAGNDAPQSNATALRRAVSATWRAAREFRRPALHNGRAAGARVPQEEGQVGPVDGHRMQA